MHKDQSGKKFNRWLLIKRVKDRKRPYYLCGCICGKRSIVRYDILLSGQSKSCGCYRSEKTTEFNTKHGKYGTDEYNIWRAMNNRCSNSKDISYKWYGERGIKICERWSVQNKNGFINFFNDMDLRPSKKDTIDRINNNKDYSPDNCRWATWATQSTNRSSNVRVEYRGEKICVSQLAQMLNVSHSSLLNKLNYYNFDI